MSDLTWFLIGFLSASILCFAAAVSYYVRARARVRAIEAAIHRYHESNKVVGEAVNTVFSQKP